MLQVERTGQRNSKATGSERHWRAYRFLASQRGDTLLLNH